MTKKYDVVIIGAGIGGLICASYLTHHGKKVLIIEKNKKAGGCCTSFSRGEFRFDAGTHLIGEAGKYGYVSYIFRRLNINSVFQRVNSDSYFYDGIRQRICLDSKQYVKEIEKLGSKNDRLSDFFRDAYEITRKVNKDFKTGKQVTDDMTFNVFSDKYISKSNKHLRAALSGYYGLLGEKPKDLSAVSYFNMLFSYLNTGTFYPIGGAQGIAEAIMKNICDHGGNFILECMPEKIVLEKETIQGVQTPNNFYACNHIVANINPHEIFSNLLKEYNSQNKHIIEKFKPSSSLFGLYIGCDLNSKDIIDKVGWHFSSMDMDNNTYIYVFSPSVYDTHCSPKACSSLEVFTSDDRKDLSATVSRTDREQRLTSRLMSIIPKLERRIIVKEVCTAEAIEKYTGNINGAAYGWAMIPNQVFGNRAYNLPKNMYMAGHWSNPGGGFLSVLISGISTAKKILGEVS